MIQNFDRDISERAYPATAWQILSRNYHHEFKRANTYIDINRHYSITIFWKVNRLKGLQDLPESYSTITTFPKPVY